MLTFLTALAIIDDLGAILVIAIFYTSTINLAFLSLVCALLALLVMCNLFGCRRPAIYITIGATGLAGNAGVGCPCQRCWYPGSHDSAGTSQTRPWLVRESARKLIKQFENIEKESVQPILGKKEQHKLVERVQESAKKATTPLRRWEHALDHPVALFVMPVFALANAGIPIDANLLPAVWGDSLSLGIVLGLVAGKAIGISLFAWLALQLTSGRLLQGVSMRHIIGVGMLGGMGFTMSIFISGLGFANAPQALVMAKTAILLASLIAGVSGFIWLRLSGGPADNIRQ